MKTRTKKVHVYSNGCVPNRLEGKKIIDHFSQQGWNITDKFEEADLIIFNSCGFCKDKIKESKEVIDKFSRIIKKDKEFILTGCLPKIDPSIAENNKKCHLEDFSAIGKILKTNPKLNSLFVSGSIEDVLETTRNDVYHIITSQGCMGKCSYCVIKRAKGSIKSKSIETVKQEFFKGIKKGFRKFILWGEDLGAYGYDRSSSIIVLLRNLLETTTDGIEYSLYLHRLNPQWLIRYKKEFKEILKSRRIKMIYSPIQSGSEKILKLMNRFYTAEEAKTCLKEVKEEFPDVLLKTDIMVGFPTESEEDFNETLAFVDEVQFDDVVLFKYGGIPGTPSYEMKGEIIDEVKDSRVKEFWFRFPYLRFNIEVIDGKGWITDFDKMVKNGPFRLNSYSYSSR